MRARAAVALAALIALAQPAHAADWVLEPEASRLGFGYTAFGEPAGGQFRRFAATARFDPATPSDTALSLTVETASIDLGNALVSALATSVEWFDAKAHPVMRFRLTDLTPQGGDRYRATGHLTIKRVTRPIAAEVTVTATGASLRARGETTVDRRSFGLGVGPVAALVPVGDRVTVSFDLQARAAAGPRTGENP